MTIGGIWADAGGHYAYIWTDSEKFSEYRDPAGEYSKLSVNALAQTAAAGCGYVSCLRVVDAALHDVQSFDAAFRVFPDVLDRAYRDASSQDSAQQIRHGLVGFSHRHRRFIACEFSLERRFQPRLCKATAWPEIDGIDDLIINEPRDLVSPALGQMQEFRRDDMRCSGHTLIVARITRDRIEVECFPQFGALVLKGFTRQT